MERSHRNIDDPIQSDAEVLLAIRDALRSVYEDVLKQPIPHRVRAILSRLEDESHLGPLDSAQSLDTPPLRRAPGAGRTLPPISAGFRRPGAEPCRPSR
jgi:hypothetical protein